MNAYNVDFAKMTITITADFAKKMNDPTSREYQTISQFLKDFPTMLDLNYAPQTNFTKLAYFFYYFLNDDDFRRLPDERLEVLMRERDHPVSRQTIANYFRRLEDVDLISRNGGDYHYYFARKANLREATREEYSRAWREYWQAKEDGCSSREALSMMCYQYGGIARKQAIIDLNGIYMNTFNAINDMVCQRIQAEIDNNG